MNDGSNHRTGCGCPLCLGQSPLEAALARAGEQAPDADELELQRLRNQVRQLQAEREESMAQVSVALEELARMGKLSDLLRRHGGAQ